MVCEGTPSRPSDQKCSDFGRTRNRPSERKEANAPNKYPSLYRYCLLVVLYSWAGQVEEDELVVPDDALEVDRSETNNSRDFDNLDRDGWSLLEELNVCPTLLLEKFLKPLDRRDPQISQWALEASKDPINRVPEATDECGSNKMRRDMSDKGLEEFRSNSGLANLSSLSHRKTCSLKVHHAPVPKKKIFAVVSWNMRDRWKANICA